MQTEHRNTLEWYLERNHGSAINFIRDGQADIITIDLLDLLSSDTELHDELHDRPARVIADFEDVAATITNTDGVTVRAINASPVIDVPDIRGRHVGNYLSVVGQAEEVTPVKQEIEVAAWRCDTDCQVITKTQRVRDEIHKPHQCRACERKGNLVLDEAASTWRDKQVVTLSALPGQTENYSRTELQIELYNDLAGEVHPGDRLRVSGTLQVDSESLNTKQSGDAVRDYYFEANGIQREQASFEELGVSRRDEIEALANDDDLFDKLIDSFAPHIVTDDAGRERKLGIILQLFGGIDRELPNGDTVRGTINTLLVGEPGTAKSQYLKYAHGIAPKSVLSSGKGATAAGLTASAEQSDFSGGWTLKAGALVLANNGLAAIDEFDKMADSARKSMHEAMEDQQIPVNKAGINAVLPAHTAVLAASNPAVGELDDYTPLRDQIDLDPALISRFDLIFKFADEPNTAFDMSVAEYQHSLADEELPDTMQPAVDTELLREYIAYARKHVTPTYAGDAVKQRAVDFYTTERERTPENGAPIGARINDSVRRLATASARARLSDTIDHEDVTRAIELVERHLDNIATDANGNRDKYLARGDDSTTQKSRIATIKLVIQKHDGIDHDDLVDAVANRGEFDATEIEHDIDKLRQRGDIYEPERGVYRTA